MTHKLEQTYHFDIDQEILGNYIDQLLEGKL